FFRCPAKDPIHTIAIFSVPGDANIASAAGEDFFLQVFCQIVSENGQYCLKCQHGHHLRFTLIIPAFYTECKEATNKKREASQRQTSRHITKEMPTGSVSGQWPPKVRSVS